MEKHIDEPNRIFEVKWLVVWVGQGQFHYHVVPEIKLCFSFLNFLVISLPIDFSTQTLSAFSSSSSSSYPLLGRRRRPQFFSSFPWVFFYFAVVVSCRVIGHFSMRFHSKFHPIGAITLFAVIILLNGSLGFQRCDRRQTKKFPSPETKTTTTKQIKQKEKDVVTSRGKKKQKRNCASCGFRSSSSSALS